MDREGLQGGRQRILRGWKQRQASGGRESKATGQHPALCLLLALLVYQKVLAGMGEVYFGEVCF